MSDRKCDAIAIVCIDFRFQKYIQKWLAENMKDKTYDLVAYAGATKSLDTIMEQIDVSVRLHHIKQAVFINHEDCGAYGAESSFERHSQDLKKAKAKTLSKYPDLQVELYHLTLEGEFQKIK